MAEHQANLRQVFSQPTTKHSYPRYTGTGDDDDADSYIKLFESVSIANRETSDEDRLRIFPSLLRRRARSWYNHESTDPTGIRTWAQLKEKFLRRFRELGYDSRVLTRLRNLRRERKENLRDYTERFQDLLDRIPKTGPGEPYSVQQAVDWYVTGLSREMETFCRRGKTDTIQDVIASAETFETSTLDTRRRDRRSTKKKSQGGRRKRRNSPSSTEESSSSESSSSSEEEEDSSSSEEERRKKKRSAIKKKDRGKGIPVKTQGDIAAKVDNLVKNFADLKVHVVGGQDRRKSPARQRANLWCTTCGQVGHANTECMSARPSYPVNAVEWAPQWENPMYYAEPPMYYAEQVEDTAYSVQTAPATTPNPPVHIPRFVPREMAGTLPPRRMAPPGNHNRPRPQFDGCYNCGDMGHYAPSCPHPRKPMGYAPLCSNCKKSGHTAAECDQPQLPRPAVRFVSTPGKEEVQVNQVELSLDPAEGDEVWPEEEVMCGRVETRSSKRRGEGHEDTRRLERREERRKSKEVREGQRRRPGTPPAMRNTQPEQNSEKADRYSEEFRTRDYLPDIKDEVSHLIKEALGAGMTSDDRKAVRPPTPLPTASTGKLPAVTSNTSYDIVKDMGSQRANISFHQLLEDNKTYRRMLMLSLRRPRKPRKEKLPAVYRVEGGDLGPPEIEVEIGGCVIQKVPVDSGSGVNIMTEETANSLGFQTFEPTSRVLRLADQTRRMPLGMLSNVRTNIGGVDFQLSYIILQPLMKKGYDVLLGRPWLYDAKARCDWSRKRLQFRSPADPPTVITVPWTKVPHEGETPSTTSGYTTGGETSSSCTSETETSEEFVGYVTCCSIEEEGDEVYPDEE